MNGLRRRIVEYSVPYLNYVAGRVACCGQLNSFRYGNGTGYYSLPLTILFLYLSIFLLIREEERRAGWQGYNL